MSLTVFDPLHPSFVADPYPTYRYLRDNEPVQRNAMGAWVVTRYDDVRDALADPRLSNAPARYAVVAPRNRERYVCADVAANILPFLDPPEHTKPRKFIGRCFTQRLRSHPPDIEGIAERVLGGWSSGEMRDIVQDYASPLAVSVIADVLGVPREDAHRLEAWSEPFFYLFTAIPSAAARDELDATLAEFRAYLGDLIAARRTRPGHDLISSLLDGTGGGLDDAQLVDNCMLLFADGVENVDRAIGNAAYTLLRHPDELAKLREQPALLPSAIDECLRYESPAQYIGRISLEKLDVAGVTIPADSMVLLVLGSANRDPRAFDEADRFDIARSPNLHLAFGRARHSCLGGPLVEQQMRIAIEVLLRRAPHLTLASEGVSFLPRPAHRWVDRVPVLIGDASP